MAENMETQTLSLAPYRELLADFGEKLLWARDYL